MLATELLKLAELNKACSEGRKWLQKWIDENPNGTASEFFKSKRNTKKLPWIYCSYGYLEWSFCHLLDWSELNDEKENISPWTCDQNQKVHDFCMELFGCSLFYTSSAKLANALARAFE